MSYLEIHKEKMIDLLTDSKKLTGNLRCCLSLQRGNTNEQGIQVKNLTEHVVRSVTDVTVSFCFL